VRQNGESPDLTADLVLVAVQALDGCELLSSALEQGFVSGPAGYGYRGDASYRAARRRVVADLRADPRLAALAAEAEQVLPKSLAECVSFSPTWWTDPAGGRRRRLISLQHRILEILDDVGWLTSLAEGAHPSSAQTNPIAGSKRSGNQAQRRAADRKRHARRLRAENRTINEIAGILGYSRRTVCNYLSEKR
jgi:hypothetical protein